MNLFQSKYTIAKAVSSIFGHLTKSSGCRILMYHSLRANVEGDIHSIYKINESSFHEQVDKLAKNDHFSFVSLKAWSSGINDIVITFDDGYLDTLRVAAPILSEYKIPFTVFVSPGLIGSDDQRFLAKKSLMELSRINGCTIGAHGYSHIKLSECSDKELENELLNSKIWLEDMLSIPVDTMSYPFGAVDRRVRNAVKEAGYEIALSSRPGGNTNSQDSLWLNRTDIWSIDDLNTFNEKINGYWDWLRWIS